MPVTPLFKRFPYMSTSEICRRAIQAVKAVKLPYDAGRLWEDCYTHLRMS